MGRNPYIVRFDCSQNSKQTNKTVMSSFVDVIDLHFSNAKTSRSFIELVAAAVAIIGIVYTLERR